MAQDILLSTAPLFAATWMAEKRMHLSSHSYRCSLATGHMMQMAAF